MAGALVEGPNWGENVILNNSDGPSLVYMCGCLGMAVLVKRFGESQRITGRKQRVFLELLSASVGVMQSQRPSKYCKRGQRHGLSGWRVTATRVKDFPC